MSLTQYATPYELQNRFKHDLGIYAQDQWAVGRLTLNLGLRYEYFNGYVPAQNLPGTPRPVVDRIADAVTSTVKDPQISKQFSSQGIVVSVMSPEQLASFVQQEAKKYAQIIKQAGVKIE